MPEKNVKPNFAATMMASIPHRDTERAIETILTNFPEAPCLQSGKAANFSGPLTGKGKRNS